MADPLSILRQYHITKKPILEKDDQIIFGENSFPKSTRTNYLVSVSGKKKSAKEYYTLESLLHFIKNIRLPHSVYAQKATSSNIPAVKESDRKDLLLFLSGVNSTSSSIDKKARIKKQSPGKVEKQEHENNQSGEVNNISSEDMDQIKESFMKFPALSSPVAGLMKDVTKKWKDELETEKGLSFLDLKIMVYSNYLTNLTYYIYKKANGEKIENDPVIERLVELRVVMEKMKPVEEKLKYQINKLLSNLSSENIDSSDPLKFRANPDNLETQDDDAPEEEETENKVYVPPKISAAYYEEDNILQQKKKALEKAKKKALSSCMLQELRKEYEIGPEEIKEMHDPYKLKISEDLKERERFEEEYMMRLPLTKKQRHEMRQLTTVTNFNTKIDDISALDMTPDSMHLKKKSSSKKGKFNSSKSKKKGFKRKR